VLQLSGPTIPNPPLLRQARIVRLASGGALHVSGPEDAPPIIFFHGVGGGAWSWEPQAVAFSRDHACYAWEARGHGEAARVADAGLGDYYTDAREALAHVVERHGSAWIAGHSMGGLLVMALAVDFPESVRGIALLEPVYAPDTSGHLGGPFGAVVRALCAPLTASVLRGGRIGRALSRRVFARAFQDRARMERAWLRQRTQVPVEYARMLSEAFTGPTDFPNRAFGREIVQPTLLMEGSVARRRPRFPQLVDELGRLDDRFAYLTVDGGHYLQLDSSEPRVTDALREFVARWST
jgi:pimeloyl-ACP methyl ester carboxylesterase